VHKIVEALQGAKLMFVFVSEKSLKSGWIFFESGYSFGRDVHVVPCTLPGLGLKELPRPLSLLQAQTLHSAKDINSILAKCNRTFGLKIPQKISRAEFESVFKTPPPEPTLIGPIRWPLLVEEIGVNFIGPPSGLSRFEKICDRAGVRCWREGYEGWKLRQLNAAGLTMRENEKWFESRRFVSIQVNGKATKPGEAERRQYEFRLSGELFHITAPLIDLWRTRIGIKPDLGGFHADITLLCEMPHDGRMASPYVSTQLYGSEIKMVAGGFFDLRGTEFFVDEEWRRRLRCFFKEALATIPIGDFLAILVQRNVLELSKETRRQLVQP
jgi:hypothetical protein